MRFFGSRGSEIGRGKPSPTAVTRRRAIGIGIMGTLALLASLARLRSREPRREIRWPLDLSEESRQLLAANRREQSLSLRRNLTARLIARIVDNHPSLANRPEDFRQDFRAALLAVAHQESRFDPRARSPTGPIGLFQINRANARAKLPGGVEGRTDPAQSTVYAAEAYAEYMDRYPELGFEERLKAAAIDYNLGITAHKKLVGLGLSENPDEFLRQMRAHALARRQHVVYYTYAKKRYSVKLAKIKETTAYVNKIGELYRQYRGKY